MHLISGHNPSSSAKGHACIEKLKEDKFPLKIRVVTMLTIQHNFQAIHVNKVDAYQGVDKARDSGEGFIDQAV